MALKIPRSLKSRRQKEWLFLAYSLYCKMQGLQNLFYFLDLVSYKPPRAMKYCSFSGTDLKNTSYFTKKNGFIQEKQRIVTQDIQAKVKP